MKILFLQKRLILPADTGGKIRTCNVVRHLAKWHELTYLCNLLDQERPWLEEMEQLGLRLETIPWREPPRRSFAFAMQAIRNLASRYPLNVDKDFDPRLRRRAQQLLRSEAYDLLICDFVQMARNAIGLPVPKLLFQHNVEADIFATQADRSRGLMAVYLRRQARRMRRFEREAGRDFDRVVAVSDHDRQRFETLYGWDHVSVIDTAVDIDYFQPDSEEPRNQRQIVFLGSMDWPPNIDGVQHFVRRIWPTVIQAVPDAKFLIVGRNPGADVKALANEPGVEVTGTVPDTRPYLQRSTVGVVPIYAGGGTRLKIFEMMASGCPVISTTLGAEGLPVKHGEHLLIADDDQEFADCLIGLLKHEDQRREMASRAAEYVRQRFNAEVVARQFETACRLVC